MLGQPSFLAIEPGLSFLSYVLIPTSQAASQGTIFFNPHLRTFFFSLLLESVGKGKREWERETLIGCLFACTPTGGQTHNLGMCPDQQSNPDRESNLQPFSIWDDAPTS